MALLLLPAFPSSSCSTTTAAAATTTILLPSTVLYQSHLSHSSIPVLCKKPTNLPSPLLLFPPTPVSITATTATTSVLPNRTRSPLYFSPLATLNSTSAATAGAESAQEPGDNNRTRLIAQNIPWTCTPEDIRNLFDKYGAVMDVELSMHNSTRNRGLAFITMASEEEAQAAINNLHSYELDGRVISVEFAMALKKKPSTVTADPVTRYTLFVGNLTWRVRSRDLREFFAASNSNLLSAEVIFQSSPRRSAGYGFVSFGSKEEAEAAIAAFNGKKLMGRAIRLVLGEKQTKLMITARKC